ncbi:hypothetical protein [Paracoccus sp. SSK6]|uniref:hypothetical protein n=1 Tax=Paracoccus sp. SSK6 TaxID=3143131 RepID=UPI0032199506
MMGRLIRQLTGHGRREAKADEIMREYEAETAPEKRAIKARVAAVERLVRKLEEDVTAWH